MTKEVPGIRPAVISTETGTRLDEYRWFRHVVRNVYTHRFDPTKLGKPVNSAPELFARTKAESLKELIVRVQKLKSAIEIGGHGSLSVRLSLTQIVNDLREIFKSKN